LRIHQETKGLVHFRKSFQPAVRNMNKM